MKSFLVFITLGLWVLSASAQCYEPNLRKADAALANGKYVEAYNYYKAASRCPDTSRFDNGRKAREGIKKCYPSLMVNGKNVYEINVGPEAGERTFNVQYDKIRMWLIGGGYRQKGVKIDTKELKRDSFRAMWESNPSNAPRDLKIRLYGVDGVKDIEAHVIIHQAAGGLRVNNQTKITKRFDGDGDCCCFELSGIPDNSQYSVLVNEGKLWCKIQQQKKRFFVLASRNSTNTDRECRIVVNCNHDSVAITIQQSTSSIPMSLPIGKIPIGKLKIKESSILPIVVNREKGYVNSNGEIVGLGENYHMVGGSKEYKGSWETWCTRTGTYRINQYCNLEVVIDSSGKKYNEVKLFSNNGELLELYTELIKNYKGDLSISIHVFDDQKFAIRVPSNRGDYRHEKKWTEFCELDNHIEYFTADGERIFTIESSYADYYEEGIAFLHRWDYYDNKKEKYKWEWSLYDRRTGKMIQMPEEVRWINDISEGVILFEYDKTKNNPVSEGVTMPLYGYCDLSGNIFIKTKFIFAKPFSEGYAFVAKPKEYCCFIDMAGNEYFNKKYAWHGRGFSEGLAAVYGQDYDYRPTFIDKYGNVKIRIDFGPCDDLDPFDSHNCKFSCGVAKIRKRPERGEYYTYHYCWLIDKSGKKIIDTTFEDATIMFHGLAGYKLDGFWGLLNNEGKIIIDHNDSCFSKNRPFFNMDGTVSLTSSSYAITVDSLGNKFDGNVGHIVKIDLTEDKIRRFKVNGLYGFYDTVSGKIICDPIYNDTKIFSDGLAAVRVGEKWGFINTTGRMVIPSVFEQVKTFSNGVSTVKIEDKTFFIDKRGIIQEQ